MVTDGEIDRFFLALVDYWFETSATRRVQPVSTRRETCDCSGGRRRLLLEAIRHARSACKLPYLTGNAVVAYGLPVVCEMLEDSKGL
jgi:hypothetical protein